jgi:hypothetical protein
MKKLFLFPLFATLIFVWACEKDPVEATPPEGTWEELVWIPVAAQGGGIRMVQMTFPEIEKLPKEQLDTLVFICKKVRFFNDEDMLVEVRYGDGWRDSDSLSCNTGNTIRKDFFTAKYTIEPGAKKDIRYIRADCKWTGPSFGNSEPLECSSKGEFRRDYDYSYENEEKTRLRMGYTIDGRWSIHTFAKQQ